MKFFLIFLSFTCFEASASFHSVGWTSALIPGGGRFMMGEYSEGAKEAGVEIGTFASGYVMSPESSITLDGTPITYPSVTPYNFKSTRQHQHTGGRAQDASTPLTAALLQEFGIKYHMLNAFLSYRDQFNLEGGDPGQGIDQRSTKEMFKDPFRLEVLSSPWVYLPIIFTTSFVIMDYKSQIKSDLPSVARLKGSSKAYLAFDQTVVYPLGSAAPEETFYRGFVQNEFYYLVRSPYFSIPMSSMIFALSHSQENWGSSFVTGLYQGMLAYKNNGDLSYGNAIHFWGVFVLGIEAYLLTVHPNSHSKAATPAVNFNFSY
jgi:hypothetical protein